MSTHVWRDGLALLAERDFARLFAARLVSAFGTAMAPIALPFAVLQDLGGSATEVGLVVASGSATQVAMLVFAGALADRGSRKRQVVGADLFAAVAQGALAALVLSGRGTVGLAVVLNAAAGAAIALHFPAHVGLVPLVVPRERLHAANALLGIAQALALALGAAAGGAIAAVLGAGSALAIDAATFLASGLLVAGIRPRLQARASRATLWRDLADGFREFTAHTWLWAIVLQFTVMLMAWVGTWAVVGPVVAQASLGGAATWGWIGAAHGVGVIAGGGTALRLRFARPMLAATLCCFPRALIPLLLIGPSPLGLLAAAAFAAGLGTGLFNVLWNTELHSRIAPEALSRVSSYDAFGSIALLPAGQALAGFGVDHSGIPATLAVCCVGIVLPTLAVLCVRDVRELRAS